jgi:L-alanine-DL-glutamate epimerase-like enolase superfamily enzyme
MKIGKDSRSDTQRVAAVRTAIGDSARIFVDANGAYSRQDAIAMAATLADFNVAWFEEPVSSDDLEGLRLLRDRAPGGMAIAAGEYAFDLFYCRRMLDAQAVDVLQADITRCGGVTGFMAIDALCDAFAIPLSAHCAPALHVASGCAARRLVHLEYFYDHQRIEHMLFDGAATPRDGALHPNDRPGLGLEFKFKDAECFRH